MIFVTTGFHSEPFDRLLRWVDEITSERLFAEPFFVQKGRSKIEFKSCYSVDFIEMEAFEKYVSTCKIVITHGGTGSIMAALTSGKKPIVVPRLKRFGEVCNDHQLEIAHQLEKQGWVCVATNKEEIITHLKKQISDNRNSKYNKNNDKLLSMISNYLETIEKEKLRREGLLRFLRCR